MQKLVRIAALAAALSVNGTAKAQSLPLDPTFGTSGVASFPSIPAYYPIDMSLQTDGKILCLYASSGNTYALRANANGSIDPTYLADLQHQLYPTPVAGALQFTGKTCIPNSALIRQTYDGKVIIVLSGYGILRTKANGSVDSTFGMVSMAPGYLDLNSGTPLHVMINIHDFYDAHALGHYYAAPTGLGASGITDSVVIGKTTTAGVLDPSYGTGGMRIIPLDTAKFGYVNEIRKITFTSNGKILFVGKSMRAAYPGNGNDMFIARYNLDGTPDAAFGSAGVKIFDFNHLSQEPWTLTTSNSGDIYVSGTQDSSGVLQYYTIKLSSTGALDASYGTGGIVISRPPGTTSTAVYPYSIAVTSYNKLYMAGFYSPGFMDYKTEYHSYSAAGMCNCSFGTSGTVNLGTYEKTNKLITLPDNKILMLAAEATYPKLMRITGDLPPNLVTTPDAETKRAWIANGTAYVVTNAATDLVTAALYNVDGRLLKQYDAADFNAGTTRTLSLPADLAAGVYLLRVQINSEMQTIQFVH